MPDESYTPPASASSIATAQNSVRNLRLLIAQRKLYSRSKRWMTLRLSGMGIIAILAPVFSLLNPKLAVVLGAIAGLWIILGRRLFLYFEKRTSAKAAYVQEVFDTQIYSMPLPGDRDPSVSLEEINSLAGNSAGIIKEAKKEHLLDWYAINSDDSGLIAIAICQRTNAAYSSDLLRTTGRAWLGLILLWVTGLCMMSMALNFTLSEFLLGIFLPLLPAFDDTFDYWRGINKASSERQLVRSDIQEKLDSNDVSHEDLLIWQTRLYNLRRDVPQVPNIIYKLSRRKNETIMKQVASQLSNNANRRR